MSDDESIDDVRARKREQLRSDGGSESVAQTPAEPFHVDTISSLDEVTSTHEAVLVDFYADWCGPCKMIEPTVEALAAETDVAVAKVDVDANQGLAAEYGVQGVPTLLLFADGEPVERVVGVQDKETLRSTIEQHT
jgi:thioredoxin 1